MLAVVAAVTARPGFPNAFDHEHAAWTLLLKKHVLLLKGGVASEVPVNCASIGCPMLREEAFVGERLNMQLAQQTQRFLSDRTRNRWNTQRGRLELSELFDWYGEDFRLGHRGIKSLAGFAAEHADLLADAPADRQRIRAENAGITFIDYDWA
jgi:hypothetical protein